MPRYSDIHSVTDFFGRMVPKRGSGSFEELFFHEGVNAIKKLDRIQESNFSLDLNFYNNDGLWVFYGGLHAFILIPAQKHMRLIVNRSWPGPAVKPLLRDIESASKQNHIFGRYDKGQAYSQWWLGRSELTALVQFVENFPREDYDSRVGADHHPRNFPSSLRRAAFIAFEAGGHKCPGVNGITKPHKLNMKMLSPNERIEYDHILPIKKGGSSSEWNIQVLCRACNSRKRAKII